MSIRIVAAASILAIVAGCTQSVENPAQSPSYIAAALGYDAYKQGDLVTAENQFESALSAEPDNPYALLGLGAVRENTGDYTAARQLYAAARGPGVDAPANYTYITEQRLERAANVDVAALAEENLARLTVRQASAQAPETTGFASYDGSAATVIEQAAYTAPVPASAMTGGGDYQTVGSYDSYIASLGGDTGTVYAEPAGVIAYDQPIMEPTFDIVPAAYGSTPYYDAPLPYDDVAVPAQYVPVASLGPAYAAPAEPSFSGPVGGVLQYGQAFGDPVDLVAMPSTGANAGVVTQSDGLIFLGDG